MAQEPNRNQKPEPSEPFFPKPKAEPEPPEPFSRNRNRNRSRPEIQKNPFLQRNRRNRKPEPLEPFHLQTVTEPNRTEPGPPLREAKPGGFQTRVFPTFFGGKVQIVSRTLSELFLVGALLIGRERGKGLIGKIPKHPRANREIPEKSGKSQKGQKRKDESRSGSPPRLKHPRLAALEKVPIFLAIFESF